MESEPARTVGRAISTAVAMASGDDSTGYALATAALTELQPETGRVLAAVVRLLLEKQHAGGLDGSDIRQVLDQCTRRARTWLPDAAVSITVLVAVVSSALGIHEAGVTYTEVGAPGSGAPAVWSDPVSGSTIGRSAGPAAVAAPAPTAEEYAWHAPLIIASLLAADGGRLTGHLDAAFAEIARSELMEMP